MTMKLSRVIDWIDERTGLRRTMRDVLDEPIRGGARWSYVFGSVLVFLFILQAVTGIFLTLYYVPSADHAHASVAFIQKAVPGGALLRGVHHYGSSAMVIMAVIHLVQVFLFGAYKQRRELVWGAGGVLLLLILGFAFTGYLLAWDQAAYFGTKVGTSIAGEIPVIGPAQQRIMLGGNDLTTLTLSRFFTTHVFLLPLGMVLLIASHIFLFRKAGPAGPYHQPTRARLDRFYPKQLFKDSIAILGIFIALIALAHRWPAELGPEADPSSDYLARPPWYFLPLFQLLKYFPGKFSIIPTVILPGLLFTLLFLLPFIDRRAERHPLKRPFATAALALVLLGAVGLIALSKYQDRKDPQFNAKLAEQHEEQKGFLAAPFKPQLIGGSTLASAPANPGTINVADPPASFINHCADCHGARGEGDSGPPLIGVSSKQNRSREDLLKILNNARSYGLRKPMPASFADLSQEDKDSIIDWLDQTKTKLEE